MRLMNTPLLVASAIVVSSAAAYNDLSHTAVAFLSHGISTVPLSTRARACTPAVHGAGLRLRVGLRPRAARQGPIVPRMQQPQWELEGTLKVVMDAMQFDSGFTKREFVVTTDEMYPQDVKFELYKEKTGLIDRFTPGEKVKVNFNIRGNEWNGKYFVNLNAWRVEPVSQSVQEHQLKADAAMDQPDWANYGNKVEPTKTPSAGSGSSGGSGGSNGWDEDIPFGE